MQSSCFCHFCAIERLSVRVLVDFWLLVRLRSTRDNGIQGVEAGRRRCLCTAGWCVWLSASLPRERGAAALLRLRHCVASNLVQRAQIEPVLLLCRCAEDKSGAVSVDELHEWQEDEQFAGNPDLKTVVPMIHKLIDGSTGPSYASVMLMLRFGAVAHSSDKTSVVTRAQIDEFFGKLKDEEIIKITRSSEPFVRCAAEF